MTPPRSKARAPSLPSRPHSFRIPDELWASLCGEAESRGSTATDLVLQALLDHLGAAQSETLSAEDLKLAREQFQQGKNCPHCGGLHLRACARVKKLEWRNKEELGSVEFWPWNEIVWPDDQLWPEDVFSEDAAASSLADGITRDGVLAEDHPED